MKKLRVALVIPTHFNIHSSLNNLLKVYKYLIKTKNVEVTIFTDKKNDVSYKGFKVVKINWIDYKNVLSKILFVLGAPRFYYTDLVGKLDGYDVIESSNPEFYGFAYQSYLAAKKYNAKLIYRTSQTVEGFLLFKLTKYLIIPIMKNAYDYASAFLFTNPGAEERCVRLGLIEKNSKKSFIVGHPTDITTFKPSKLKKTKNNTIILSVGGLYKIKGHHLIIKALKKVIEMGHDAELWIVGEGYYKKNLVKLAKELGISDKVKLFGSKSHKELAKIYNSSDIFVLANYQEITPAVNEALACRIPVVVMECGGRQFVIPDESYGLVAKKFDVKDMADKIIRLIEDKILSSKIAEKGRRNIITNFSVKSVAEKVYRAVVK